MLRRCIESFLATDLDVHLFVVANGDGVDYAQTVRDERITYLVSRVNHGYGAGHNIAITRALTESEFHLVVNPDVYFEPGTLELLVERMESDPTIGQIMPKVVYPDGTIQRLCKLLPTPANLFLRRFLPGSPLTDRLDRIFELRDFDYASELDVPYLSGCFMFLRTAALRQVGLFDERFFLYPEDIDLTRRIHARYRTLFFPQCTVVHAHAKESYKSIRMTLVHIVNIMKYFNKWGWFFDSERAKMNRHTLKRIIGQSGSAKT